MNVQHKLLHQQGGQEGFTLIELMIVVAILAILAAIAIPLYLNYTARAQATGAVNLAGGLKTDVVEYYNTNGAWPADNKAAGAAKNISIVGKYVSQVDVLNGKIRAKFCDVTAAAHQGVKCEAAKELGNKTLTLSPSAHAGSIVWNCYVSNSAIYKMVPSECRHAGP
ncbi:MAG: pilin [Gammaproteobacteria bacterium]